MGRLRTVASSFCNSGYCLRYILESHLLLIFITFCIYLNFKDLKYPSWISSTASWVNAHLMSIYGVSVAAVKILKGFPS